jgi:hypothetical protein
MPRLPGPALCAVLVTALTGPLQGALPALAQTTAQPASSAASTALSVDQARQAAIRILEAVKTGNAQARFQQFSPEMQAVTSPSMIAATMRTQPKILGYSLLSVRSGLQGSIVEAELRTKLGNRVLFLVLTPTGRIQRYYIDRADDPSSTVALNFVRAVSTGNFITAQSFLAPDFQAEITPAALQSKWLELQRLTGNFKSLGRAIEAESTPDARLVLVNVNFNRLSDNLFLVFNSDNQIIGIDFPEVSPGGASVR